MMIYQGNSRSNEQKRFRIIRFIRAYMDDRGYPPTLQEIADHVGLSKSNVKTLLEALQIRGWVDPLVKKPQLQRLMGDVPA